MDIDVYKEDCLGEVVDNMGDVEFTIGGLDFNYDPEFIIAYQNSDKYYERDIEDYKNNQ